MKKILRIIRMFFISFFYGLRKTEEEVLSQNGQDSNGMGVHREIHDRTVAKSLLKGEVTQEVADLRYRNYEVAKESKKFNVYSPLLAKKKQNFDSKFVKYENSDNLEVIVIQPCEYIKEGVVDAIKNIDLSNAPIDKNNEISMEIGGIKKKNNNYTIKVTRDLMSRFNIEEFTTKLVVKKGTTDNTVVLDFYVSKYPNELKYKTKGFIKEIEYFINDGRSTEIFDIQKIHFITNHAYLLEDMIEFYFKNLKFDKVVEFDGSYVIKYTADFECDAKDITEEFYSENMAKKYKEKAPKQRTVSLEDIDISFIENNSENKFYICENCGKKIFADTKALDELDPINPDDENITKTNYMEFYDTEIIKESCGKTLCKTCFENEINELYKKTKK